VCPMSHPDDRDRPVFTERNRIRIAALEPGDGEAVMAMLGRCSSTTLYHRFHGVTDGVAHVTQVLTEIPGQDAFGAWCADRCVGLASLALDSDGSTHIGVLVEDDWQRQRVGSALVAAVLHRARQRKVASLVADVLADDAFILPLLARIGPTTTSCDCGSFTVRLGVQEQERRSEANGAILATRMAVDAPDHSRPFGRRSPASLRPSTAHRSDWTTPTADLPGSGS
jgi:GNAT superfamily N-acetyltransferase